jgi:zinc/manganese transport system permease protein
LWSTWASLAPIAALYAVILAVWFLFRNRFGSWIFYVAFAIVVTASVQIVGIYLVFASLIIPALATLRLRRGNRLMIGYVIGGLSYFVGIVASSLLDLPTGAIIVWSMAVISLIAGFLISKKRPA